MALIYVDMDNVIVDFKSALRKRNIDENMENADEIQDIFSEMDPMPGAIEGYNKLVEMGHDVYILSTAPWENPSAWSDKLLWVKKYLGMVAYKRLILSHNKNLNSGDYLIDDRVANGAGKWGKKLLRFGFDENGKPFDYPNWDSIIKFFRSLK
jgi:5'(3')-deoxyribonucleotidase